MAIYGILWNIATFWTQLVKENVQKLPKGHSEVNQRSFKVIEGIIWGRIP